MKARLQAFVENCWYHSKVFGWCLSPLSFLYRIIIAVRFFIYRLAFRKVTYFPVPVIVVGNITVGGSGKSPLVAMLVHALRQQGKTPGIVSRGYGGKALKHVVAVTAESTAADVGDEALMLFEQTAAPMMVCAKRPLAVTNLLQQNPEVDVVISDDGLQHYALTRDVEIAVLDGKRRLGNGFCLPAGPLREPAKRLETVSAVVVNGVARDDELSMQLVPQALQPLKHTGLVAPQSGATVHAVAAIGNPQRFFDSLRSLGFEVVEHAFPDHHAYLKTDLSFNDDLPIIMTHKDAVKCRAFAPVNSWYLPVVAECPELISAIVGCL